MQDSWNLRYRSLSGQFSHSAMSNSLRSHGLQYGRLPYPSSNPRAYSDSCPLSWWCHPTILSSIAPLSSCLQSFPASGSFPMSQFFASGGQSIGVSASASVLPMNIQDWFPLGWTGWISLQSEGLSGVFSNTTVQKHQFFCIQLSLQSNSHIHLWLHVTETVTSLSLQFNSLTQSCLIICNPMDCSMPVFSVHHQLLDLAQTHVHWVGDAIQPSCPLPSPSPSALFQWVSSSHQVAKVLELQLQPSVLSMNIQDSFPLGLTGLILQSMGFSRVFPTPRFESISFSVLSLLYGPVLTSIHDCWKNHSFDSMDFCWQSDVSAF